MESKQTITFDKIEYKEMLQESSKHTGFSVDYFQEYKIKDLKYEIDNDIHLKSKTSLKILNFGCGIGLSDSYILNIFNSDSINIELYGCDISEKSIEIAKKQNSENVTYMTCNGQKLPFNEKFDIIFIANVIRHIPRKNHIQQIKMLKNALKENGIILMYEFNPFNPVTLYFYNRYDCRYDAENVKIMTPYYAKKLFKDSGFNNIKIRYRFFIPGFMKKFIFMEKYLKNCPLGANYYLIVKNTN